MVLQTDNAPITSLMLTVQFAPAQDLNPVQIADFYAPFRDEFPIYEQTGRAGPMPLNPLQPTEPSLGSPRNAFISQDRQYSLLFQDDRFSYGWNRLSSLSDHSGYPGYESSISRAEHHWGLMLSSFARSGVSPEPLVGELSYIDSFVIGQGGADPRLSAIFNVLNPEFRVLMAGFNFAWNEPSETGEITQVRVAGPARSIHGEIAAQLSTITRFPLHGNWGGMRSGFDSAHAAVSKLFVRLINPAVRPT